MKLSINWLQNFLDLKNLDAKIIGDKLTLHTAELEEIFYEKDFFENIVAGQMISCEKIPESEKLFVGTFDLGTYGKKQIVFTRKTDSYPHGVEIEENEIVPVAMVGANLKCGIKIKKSKLCGQTSEGMVCVNTELGMKNEGMLKFTKKDIGKKLGEICPEFEDIIFDIDNKSLTHRPDLVGHRGIAREIAAIFDKKLNLSNPKISFDNTKKFPIEIQTPHCRRFCGVKIDNVCVKNSDLQMQMRLENCGIRAISNLVDITNWILLEFGQPMHVFDAKKVKEKIIIRQAKKGEKLLALDGETYELDPSDIVIADAEKVLSIAGIMGGLDSSVTEETTDIIFESANFDPVSIRKTSQRLGLRSESSMRFEKSLDPENCLPALNYATFLLDKFCPNNQKNYSITDVYKQKLPQINISLDPQKVKQISGLDLNNQEIKKILTSIGFSLKEKNKKFQVRVPSFRSTKDIDIEEDLIEEIVRLQGLNKIPSVLPKLVNTPPKKNNLRSLEWKIRDFFSNAGLWEIYEDSFANTEDIEFTGEKEKYIKVENPLSAEYSFLRTTLISKFVLKCETELRAHNKLNLFELAKTYENFSEESLVVNSTDICRVNNGRNCTKFKNTQEQKNNFVKKEILKLGIFVSEINADENKKFFELKNKITAFLNSLHLNVNFCPNKNFLQYFHPSKNAAIFANDLNLGNIFVLHPKYLPAKNAATVCAEIDIEKILSLQNFDIKHKESSVFPPVFRDLSIILDKKILMSDIQKKSFSVSKILTKMECFDEYLDEEKLGENKKNLSFHLEFRSSQKTLEEKEIEENFNKIVKILEKNFDAKLRLDF